MSNMSCFQFKSIPNTEGKTVIGIKIFVVNRSRRFPGHDFLKNLFENRFLPTATTNPFISYSADIEVVALRLLLLMIAKDINNEKCEKFQFPHYDENI